jgi:uncharacterized protein
MSRQPTTSRRQFLTRAAALTAACGLAKPPHSALAQNSAVPKPNALIDTHTYIGDWPNAYLPDAQPQKLAELLRANNVTQAWVGSFDGLFHKDIAGVNERLANACADQTQRQLIPFGTVNPTLPDWEDDIRRCAETHRMPGIRLHPNYHGYTLYNPRFANLLTLASQRNLVLQLVAVLDNKPHKWLSPPTTSVDLKPLSKVAANLTGLRLLISGRCELDDSSLDELSALSSIYFECPLTAGPAALTKMLNTITAARLVLGSAAPLHPQKPAIEKLQTAAISDAQKESISSANADRLLRNS